MHRVARTMQSSCAIFHITMFVLSRPQLVVLSAFFVFALTAVFLFTALPARTAECVLRPGFSYKAPDASTVYYITDACTKRAFTREDIFFTYFDSWSAVAPAYASHLVSVPNDPLGFMPYGPLYDPKDGALVKTVDDPNVYLLLGTQKFPIVSEEVFNGLGYSWSWIEDVDPRVLDFYALGGDIAVTDQHPNFTLVKYAHSSKVYRLEERSSGQIKRHIVDEETLHKLGFRIDHIVTIPDTEEYVDGDSLTADDIVATRRGFNQHAESLVCESNQHPVFTAHIIDPQYITNIVTPPTRDNRDNSLNAHSYIDTSVGIYPLYAPVDMELYEGAHYTIGPYKLSFRVSCEISILLMHVTSPVQKIVDALPAEPVDGSADLSISPTIAFQAGELIGYSAYPDDTKGGFDFGVSNSMVQNRYTGLEHLVSSTSVCPYDFFTDDLRSAYASKFNLVTHGGLIFDDESFCL